MILEYINRIGQKINREDKYVIKLNNISKMKYKTPCEVRIHQLDLQAKLANP